MPGFDSGSVMYALNVDFTGNSLTSGTAQVTQNGQLLIGSAASPQIRVGNITSPGGSLTIGYSAPNITIDVAGSALAVTKFNVDNASGTGTNPVLPSSGAVTITGGQYATGTMGTRVIDISSLSANTINVLLQQTTAVSSTNSNKNGIAHFNSSYFSVDANGFVSAANPSGFPWTDVTGATQTLATNNGYVTDHANVTYTLPATAVLGDTIKIVGKVGITTIAQNANQQIDMGSASSTVGVGGSVAGTNAGDCVELICITAGASTVWRAANWVGNWTVT